MIFKKLRSNRGETMVEMLVSIALLVLAMSILAAALSSAYSITQASRNADKNYYEDLSAAERKEGSGTSGTVKISRSGGSEVNISVEIYGNESDLGSLKSYSFKG